MPQETQAIVIALLTYVPLAQRGVRTRRSIVVSTDLDGMRERSKKAVDDGFAMAKGLVLLPSRAGK